MIMMKERILISAIMTSNVIKLNINDSLTKAEKLFKENTEKVLKERLDYLSMKTNISYNSVKVRDAKTKYGSCTPKTKALLTKCFFAL